MLDNFNCLRACTAGCGRAISWALVLAVAIGRICWAAGGDLDPEFGLGGEVLLSSRSGPSRASSVRLQDDGKLLIAGAIDGRYGVARLNADGSLDRSFGANGLALFGNGLASALILHPDGRIVSAGVISRACEPWPCISVVRLSTDGTPDSSFGGQGGMQTVLFPQSAIANSLLLLTDGRYVVGGNVLQDDAATKWSALARLLPDGQLDETFGSKGKITLGRTHAGEIQNELHSLTLLPDGKIVGLGRSESRAVDALLVTRFNRSGNLDTGFGNHGVFVKDYFHIPRFPANAAYRAEVLADNSLVVAGTVLRSAGNSDMALLKLTSTGLLAPDFASNGRLLMDKGQRSEMGVALKPTRDGRLIVGGVTAKSDSHLSFWIVRVSHDGTLDKSFGRSGSVITDFGIDGHDTLDSLSDLVIQPDGKIVAVGASVTSTGRSAIAVARYLPE